MNELDKRIIAERGMSEEEVLRQIECLKHGFPDLDIVQAATAPKFIKVLSPENIEKYVSLWKDFALDHKAVKFVPASGAASRMFKDLFEYLNADDAPMSPAVEKFFNNISQFAFYNSLKDIIPLDTLIANKEYKKILRALLSKEGLNYGAIPKGAILFHNYDDAPRTPIAEHLKEGEMFAKSNGSINIHFTIPQNEQALFESIVANAKSCTTSTFNISYSIQKPSTDTISLNDAGELVRNDAGELQFRPGGHGSLIENLNEIDADIVFIKNIDNVVPDRLKNFDYQMAMAGMIVELQKDIFTFLSELDSQSCSDQRLDQMLHYIDEHLCVHNPNAVALPHDEKAKYIFDTLNRPLRICGMVKNEGEPGGGPFIVRNFNGVEQLQILESSQIPADKKALMQNATHFNPVDIVCSFKNYTGKQFNLPQYVDPATGFISTKTKEGVAMKVLERPGLWNGAMSNWNTLFVEVPISTFNPVKTVNDLLRDAHRS